MGQRYMIRMFRDSANGEGTSAGTVVEPVDRHMSIYAESAEHAEEILRTDVRSGKLPAGRVYQVCPWVGNAELIRSLAISTEGGAERVFLDPTSPYSSLRRVRLPGSRPEKHDEVAVPEISLFRQ